MNDKKSEQLNNTERGMYFRQFLILINFSFKVIEYF